MKTRVFSLIMVLILSTSFAFSQKTSFGIQAGVNLQNLNGKDYEGNKLENVLMPGFHAGMNVQIPFAPEFYFQPGLMFSMKGAKTSKTSTAESIKLSYVELPLNLVYKALVGNGYVMLGFGPYLGYAIGGKIVSDNNDNINIEFQNVVEANDPVSSPYYKAFDAGANIFFGYELASGIFVQLDSQLGFLTINPEYKVLPNDKSIIKNTGFGLSLGYRF